MARKECTDSHTKRPRARWKLIIAAETPWHGEVYDTRPDHVRASFCSAEAFCRTIMEATGWDLELTARRTPPLNPNARVRAQGRGPRLAVAGAPPGSRPTTGKIVLAADEPWSGELYLTRPGLARIRFTSFEELLVGVMQITGWPLCDSRSARAS